MGIALPKPPVTEKRVASFTDQREYIEKLYVKVYILFNTTNYLKIYTLDFKNIMLSIKKGNLDLIHNKNSYQQLHDSSRKRKVDKLYNEV